LGQVITDRGSDVGVVQVGTTHWVGASRGGGEFVGECPVCEERYQLVGVVMRWLIGVCRVGLGEVGVLGGWHFVLVPGQGLEGAGLAGSGSPEVAGFVVGGNDHGCFLPG